MRPLADRVLTLLIPASILIHLIAAPYTKVEESFNIQATHDILNYGVPYPWDQHAVLRLRDQYDHLTFTGSVPRTFVGPLALAGASWPWIRLFKEPDNELGRQLIVRAVLGLFNASCLLAFRSSVSDSLGRIAGNWYVIFQASQFHMMFYASRTLPNFLALGITTFATSLIMRNFLPLVGRSHSSSTSNTRYFIAVAILTFSGIVFRAEIGLLLACYALYLLVAPHIQLPLSALIRPGLLGAIVGLTFSVPIDTYFWQSYPPTLLWPEMTGFLYNIYNNNAQNWGTQPWHFYFTSALPRLLLNPLIWQICLPFAILMPIFRRPAADVLIPNLLFIGIYSFQPHKEWRFIVYVIPPLLAVASTSASWIWTRRAKNFMYRVMSLALIASTLATYIASFGMLFVSRLNYPGGEALIRLHHLAANETGLLRVHMDTFSCMNGVTRFLQKQSPALIDGVMQPDDTYWVYDKTEDQTRLLDPVFWENVDYALAEDPKLVIGRWEVIETVNAFAGMGIVRPGEESTIGKPGVSTIPSFAFSEGRKWIGKGQSVWSEGLDGQELVLVQESVEDSWNFLQSVLRDFVTRGWWVKAKMTTKVYILRREKILYDFEEGSEN